jgi:ATP adenylyltransferase
MKRIWASWRNPYIKGIQKQEDCFFCTMIKEMNDQKNLILVRGKGVFVVLNKFPYTNGHLMVVPYQHGPDLNNLTSAVMLELIETTKNTVNWLKKSMNPQGFNIGMNLGKSAGAGLEDHLHMHIVPRWTGDSNFMSTISETRVISESLHDSYQSIRNAIEQEGVKK